MGEVLVDDSSPVLMSPSMWRCHIPSFCLPFITQGSRSLICTVNLGSMTWACSTQGLRLPPGGGRGRLPTGSPALLCLSLCQSYQFMQKTDLYWPLVCIAGTVLDLGLQQRTRQTEVLVSGDKEAINEKA